MGVLFEVLGHVDEAGCAEEVLLLLFDEDGREEAWRCVVQYILLRQFPVVALRIRHDILDEVLLLLHESGVLLVLLANFYKIRQN